MGSILVPLALLTFAVVGMFLINRYEKKHPCTKEQKIEGANALAEAMGNVGMAFVMLILLAPMVVIGILVLVIVLG